VLAQTTLQQARAGEALARARWGYARLTAPVAGTLIARQVEVGDVVQPGKSLMTLSPAGDTQIVAQIDERMLKWLRVGQTARVSADAFAQLRFMARLVYKDRSCGCFCSKACCSAAWVLWVDRVWPTAPCNGGSKPSDTPTALPWWC
jgi:pyruvate/2-oxoglutarate dehydrogenase complex dihydrolipoamide acyltransferase (E2) component